MKLFSIGAGLFFLLNPVVGVYDVLPDFIGCFLVILGIRDAAYMIEKFASAARWFRYAALISILRFAVSIMGVERQHTLPLTLAFVFAVVEMIVYIPAFKDLFAGFDYAAMRHGGSGILSLGRRMGIYTDESGVRRYGEIQDDTTGRLATLFSVFTVIRAVLSVVPELPALQLSESENVGEITGFQFSSVGNLIRAAVVVIVLIPAVITFVKYLRFLLRIRKAGDFIPEIYAELGRRFGDLRELHTSTRMKTLSLVIGAAVLLYMGFYDYQMNVIPRYIPAAILCAAAVMLAASADKKALCLLPVIPAIGAMPLSFMTAKLQRDHYSVYKQQMMDLFDSGEQFVPDRHINEPDAEYMRMALWESAEALVLGATIVLLLVLYLRVTLRHAASFASVPERDRVPLAKSLKIRGGLMIGGAALSAAYFTAYRFILPYFDSASIVGIAVNVVSVALFASFALQANRFAYGNNYEV